MSERPPSQPPADPSGRPQSGPQKAVRSAARSQPLAPEEKADASTRLKEGASDTLLNTVSILGEVIEDFRNSDRFFKYKALVLSLWGLLMIGAFGVACPSSGPSNDISAVLVVSGEANKPIYMVKNDSADPWLDVEILVNGKYRATMSQLAVGGGATLSPAVLFDERGQRAPSGLSVTEIQVHVRDPESDVVLLRSGVPQH